jgi:hypothetical protein
MVEIGRVLVYAGNAPVEQKITTFPQGDTRAFVSASLEIKGPPGGPLRIKWRYAREA